MYTSQSKLTLALARIIIDECRDGEPMARVALMFFLNAIKCRDEKIARLMINVKIRTPPLNEL